MSHNDESTFQTSGEVLEHLYKRQFSSLTDLESNVYSFGDLGHIPDVYPLLLTALENVLGQEFSVEIDPGMSVTLTQVGAGRLAPSAFISFGRKIRNGHFLISSFCPVKSFSWLEAAEMTKTIGNEIDALITDMRESLGGKKWELHRGNVISRLIQEKASLVNNALHSKGFQKIDIGERILYKIPSANLMNIALDYSGSTLRVAFRENPKVVGENAENFQELISTIFSLAMEPLKALNDESITNQRINEINDFVDQYISSFSCKTPIELVESLDVYAKNNPNRNSLTDRFRNEAQRYIGIISIEFVVKAFLELMKPSFDDEKTLTDFCKVIISQFQRNFFLGISLFKADFIEELRKTLPELLTKFTSEAEIGTLQKKAMNNALIQADLALEAYGGVLDLPEIGLPLVRDAFLRNYQEFLEEKIRSSYNNHQHIDSLIMCLEQIFQLAFQNLPDILLLKEDFQNAQKIDETVIKQVVSSFLSDLSKELNISPLVTEFEKIIQSLVDEESKKEEEEKQAREQKMSATSPDQENTDESGDPTQIIPLERHPVLEITNLSTFCKTKIEELVNSTLDDQKAFINSYFGEKIPDEFFLKLNKFSKRRKEVTEDIPAFVKQVFHVDKAISGVNYSLSWKDLNTSLKEFLLYWSKDFSGLLPEEVKIRLNKGLIYLLFDYRLHGSFGALLIRDNKRGKLDFGAIRELARNAIVSKELELNI